MALIALHESDRTNFPNLALMKLSAYHKAQGDHVERWIPMVKYDRVYSSKVFTFSPEELKYDVLGYKKTTWNVEPAVAATRKKVVCIQTGKEYKSLAEAASEFCGRVSALCSHLKGKTGSFSGYQWRYANE